jgi:hypothetical protein
MKTSTTLADAWGQEYGVPKGGYASVVVEKAKGRMSREGQRGSGTSKDRRVLGGCPATIKAGPQPAILVAICPAQLKSGPFLWSAEAASGLCAAIQMNPT